MRVFPLSTIASLTEHRSMHPSSDLGSLHQRAQAAIATAIEVRGEAARLLEELAATRRWAYRLRAERQNGCEDAPAPPVVRGERQQGEHGQPSPV
jgi:hypothetical protein